MGNYRGYLIKFGNTPLPLSFIAQDQENKQVPNQREEIEAYRDSDTRELHRVTATGQITKMAYVIRELTEDEMRAFRNVLNASVINAKQRTYNVTYFNIESLRYEQGEFYIPDIEYTIKVATNEYVLFDKFKIEFIGCKTSVGVAG